MGEIIDLLEGGSARRESVSGTSRIVGPHGDKLRGEDENPAQEHRRSGPDSFIFDLSEKGFAPEKICKTLDFEGHKTPQHRRCKWRHLSWSDAYGKPRFQTSVRKYISTARRRERERRQTG